MAAGAFVGGSSTHKHVRGGRGPRGRAGFRVAARASDAKKIMYDAHSRNKMAAGVNLLADAVSVTLGPRGRNVVLEDKFGSPKIVNDGVTIARDITLRDPAENAGAALIKEVASRANDSAGDGTTTATVLARELVNQGILAITSGRNAVNVKKGMDKAAKFLVGKLRENAKQVSGFADIKNVAAISAGNDEEIGQMIADALEKVGVEGIIVIESSNGSETTVEVEEGMEIDRGYISPQFVTNVEKSLCEFEDALVLITDIKIENISTLIPILEKVTQLQKPLVIIAEDITGDALATLVVNNMRGILKVVAIKAPSFGERRKQVLQDIAIVTGADVVSSDLQMKLEECEVEQLGRARKVTIAKTRTTLVADQGTREEISARVGQLKKDLEGSDSTYDREKLGERIAKLAGGVAVVKVGANTETELEDRKLRIEDAKNATFAAVEEGIVPGGGATMVHLAAMMPAFIETIADADERMGCEIVMNALQAPCRIIGDNAGVEGAVVLEKVMNGDFTFGYNAMSGEYVNMLEAGIIDPAKVTRTCIETATSIAGMLLTTQAVMVDAPKKKSTKGAAADMGGGMPGMGEYSL